MAGGAWVGSLGVGRLRCVLRNRPEHGTRPVDGLLRLSGLDLLLGVLVLVNLPHGDRLVERVAGRRELALNPVPVGLEGVLALGRVGVRLGEGVVVLVLLAGDRGDHGEEGVGGGDGAAGERALDGGRVLELEIGVSHQNSVSFWVGRCRRSAERLTLIVAHAASSAKPLGVSLVGRMMTHVWCLSGGSISQTPSSG